MIVLHIVFENGETMEVYTVKSRIDQDLENAGKMGKIKSWNVEEL